MTKKEKVLNFVKENKCAIIGGVAAGIGCLIGYKYCIHTFKNKIFVENDMLKAMLIDAQNTYNKGDLCMHVKACKNDAPLQIEQLGTLGEYIRNEVGKNENYDFTHFITIGKKIEN